MSSPTTLAIDLHLHSRYADGVSPAMTLENIIPCAQRKGIDILGTGDCLQPAWLHEIETKLCETGTGLLALGPEMEATERQVLPLRWRRPLRFALSTEVCCAPRGTPRLGGLHHLLYFRSTNSVRKFRSRVAHFGNLEAGRPTLTLSSKALLEIVLEHGDGCELAPAHVFNPWYSTLGSISGRPSLAEVFGALTPHLLAVEMGLTATPQMCRRVSSLDPHALFCGSDAHSLEKIGREYTLANIEPTYDALMEILRTGATSPALQWIKFPVERTRYYRNWCGRCRRSFDATTCWRCGRQLAIGSHDRLDAIAERPAENRFAEACRELLPLTLILAEMMGVAVANRRVRHAYDRLLSALGHERYILTEAGEDEIAATTTAAFARAIVRQRKLGADVYCPWQYSLNL